MKKLDKDPTDLEALNEMEALIDELIKVAISLTELSKHDISEKAIAPLQEKQENLLGKIFALNEKHIKKSLKKSDEQAQKIRERIQKKLIKFQKLNERFISHLRRSREVIDFD